MTPPRVLIVSGSAGHGHVMAANALHEALSQNHPGLDVAHVDAVKRMAATYARIYSWGYVRLVDRHPYLWRLLYDQTDKKTSWLGHTLSVVGGRAFVRACERWKPDVIVCTQFLAPELLSKAMRKGRLDAELHCVVTDHDAHRVWYWPEVSRYYVASDLVKSRLVLRYGVSEDAVDVTGIPVRRQFTRAHDLVADRARLGVDRDRPTIVFLSGGFAAGPMLDAILGVWSERRDAQIIAICGRNTRLRRRVEALPRPTGATLKVLGFVEDVASVLGIADIVVSKAGGISTAECTALGKPMVLSGAIPGQEERNVLALVGAGAAYYAPTASEVRYHVARLINDPVTLALTAERAKAFGKPRAADVIAAHVARVAAPSRPLRGPHFHGARRGPR